MVLARYPASETTAGGDAGSTRDEAELRRAANAWLAARPLGAWIYWLDLWITAAVSYGGLALALRYPVGSAVNLAAIVVAGFAAYRGIYFVHEIVHLRARLPGFEWVWHLLFGLPAGVPSFMVARHAEHHRPSSYGTMHDPEYAAVAQWSRAGLLLSLVAMLVVPPVMWLRWALLAPLSLLSTRLRRVTVERLSVMAINPSYRRPSPRGVERRQWRLQELASTMFAWLLAGGVLASWWSLTLLLHGWAALAVALLVNQLKTLLTHAFELDMQRSVDRRAQLVDSVTLAGSWLTEIWAPLGNRYHALHHLVPQVPYHALGKLHRELCQHPAAAVYRATERRGAWHASVELWRRAGGTAAEQAVVANTVR